MHVKEGLALAGKSKEEITSSQHKGLALKARRCAHLRAGGARMCLLPNRLGE